MVLLTLPTPQEPVADPGGRMQASWYRKLRELLDRINGRGGPALLHSYTVAGLPSASASGAGAVVYVSNETGGAVPAFSDGTAWRRLTDRAVVS